MPNTQLISHVLRRRGALLLTAPVLGLASIVALGCGDDVPPNAVAKVGDDVIKKSEFDKFYEIAAKGQGGQGGAAVAPDPPNFTKCIAAQQKQAPKAQKKNTDQFKSQCEQQYKATKDQVMQFLIQAEWIEQEAENRGVEVSDKEVRKQFEDQKKQSFPKEKDYQEFLKESGMTESDILFQVKLDVLQNKLREKVVEDAKNISDEDLQEEYDKNKQRFSQPERRDLKVVLTKNKAQAERAKKALEDGQSFKAVAKKYSTDDASKSEGGSLNDVSKGQQEKALDEAVFSADKGKLQGPVKTEFGWYVFRVDEVKPASQQSFEQVKEGLRGQLRSKKEQETLNDFIKDFRDKFKKETHCAKGYVVEECENAPKKQSSTAAPGAPGQPGAPPSGGGAPQGAPPGGAPQGGAPQGGAVPQQGAPPSGAPQQVPQQAPPPGQ